MESLLITKNRNGEIVIADGSGYMAIPYSEKLAKITQDEFREFIEKKLKELALDIENKSKKKARKCLSCAFE